ncbi:MAG: hypothetical protein AB1401_03665 [Thermodesulfobacteriota bacterium]
MPQNGEIDSEGVVINEVQLLLAEKRTSLSAMRTGIAVLALPLSVLSILIATSKYYDVIQVIHLFVPALVISAILFFLGSYLIIRGIIRIRYYDRIILELKQKYSRIAEFID